MYNIYQFFGLSGSGKTTLAKLLYNYIIKNKSSSVKLYDGDELRKIYNNNDFSKKGRYKQLTHVIDKLKKEYLVYEYIIVSMILPYEEMRQKIKDVFGKNVKLIYLSTPLCVCEQRDRKGYYALAKQGKIDNFTGINAPFEKPSIYDIKIDTSILSENECLMKVLNDGC